MAGRGACEVRQRRGRDDDPGRSEPPQQCLQQKSVHRTETRTLFGTYPLLRSSSEMPPSHTTFLLAAPMRQREKYGQTYTDAGQESRLPRAVLGDFLPCPSHSTMDPEGIFSDQSSSLPPPTGWWGRTVYKVLGNVPAEGPRCVTVRARS